MQAIAETVFDICYLVGVITIGFKMFLNAGDNKEYKLFGIMAIILGLGDSFHLIPRAYALWTTGLEANAKYLGIGKLITSITMTVFYMILYHIWRMRYDIEGRKGLTYSMYGLAATRIGLCLFPQNQWLSYDAPISWAIYRNIPFAIIGILIIVLFYQEIKRTEDENFKYMPLAIALSFGFYAPVVLFSNIMPIIGVLMIPKTLAYVWVVYMGYGEMKDNLGDLQQVN